MNRLTITQYIVWFLFASATTAGLFYRTVKAYNNLSNTTDLRKSKVIFYFDFLWDLLFMLMAWCYGFFLQLFTPMQFMKGLYTTMIFFMLQQDLKKQIDYSAWTEVSFFILYVTLITFMFQ